MLSCTCKQIKQVLIENKCVFVSKTNNKTTTKMEKLLLGITLSLFFLSFGSNGCDAQSLSNLVLSSTQQATNSTVVATVTATPASASWILAWSIDSTGIGSVTFIYNAPPATSILAPGSSVSIYQDRVIVNAAFVDPGVSNQFTTSLTIYELQLNDSASVVSIGGGSVISSSATLLVKDCPHTISSSSNVIVEANSYIYNAQGTFNSSNNGELFYSDGTKLSSSVTTCRDSAIWSSQDNLQSWTAPNATLVGNLTMAVDSNLTVTCDYVDTTPIGTESIFYIGNASYTSLKNVPFTLPFSLNIAHNNTAVSCQALTSFTNISTYSDRGISSVRNLIILAICNAADIPRLSVEVCLADPSQAGSTIVEGGAINVTHCQSNFCNSLLFITCRASGWAGDPFSCIPETDCFNGGDIAITVIFGLLILLCMGYDAWFVFACPHDHPDEWRVQDIAALITALFSLASFLGLLIGYSVNYEHKASCYSSGEYYILTSGELGGIIAGCSIFYLGCYISMLIWYLTCKPGMRAKATPGKNSMEM